VETLKGPDGKGFNGRPRRLRSRPAAKRRVERNLAGAKTSPPRFSGEAEGAISGKRGDADGRIQTKIEGKSKRKDSKELISRPRRGVDVALPNPAPMLA